MVPGAFLFAKIFLLPIDTACYRLYTSYMEKALLTISEVSRILGVARKTVYAMIGRGQLQAVPVASTKRITRESLNAVTGKPEMTL